MIIGGIILLIAGIASAVYGNSLNNDISSQLKSVFSSGQANPGNVWLYLGIAVAVVGLVLLIAGLVKANKK